MKLGRLAIVAQISQLPATQHDLTSFIVDVIHLSVSEYHLLLIYYDTCDKRTLWVSLHGRYPLSQVFISRGAEGPGREILECPPSVSVRLSVRPSHLVFAL